MFGVIFPIAYGYVELPHRFTQVIRSLCVSSVFKELSEVRIKSLYAVEVTERKVL